jgi:hypothetical protein
LPVYFYFDGLVFDFSDKWHRANGNFREMTELTTYQERLPAVESDLERQTLFRKGQLKLSKWEHAMSDEEMHHLHHEAEKLGKEISRLTALLEQREAERQRHVQSGLLRLAPKTLHEIALHGKTRFPQFAFSPGPAASTAASPAVDELAPAGKTRDVLVALEDGFPVKNQLALADLCVLMPDVESVEARDR